MTDITRKLPGLTRRMPDERTWFLLISIGSAMGIAVELAAERHWTTAVQMIPWFALGLLAVAIGLRLRLTRANERAVRVIAAVVGLSGLIGVYKHVAANVHAGPLDYRYTKRWPSMGMTSHWWAGISKSVGPSPPFAPMALALSALCLVLSLPRRAAPDEPGTPDY
jgi:hypothetical protein